MGIETAILAGSTLLAGGASALSASSAAKKAANASQYATDQSVALQRDILDTIQGNTATQRQVGNAALTVLAQRYGLTLPEVQAAARAVGVEVPQDNSSGVPGFGGSSSAGNWDAYLQADPGIAQEFGRLSEGRKQALGVNSLQDFAKWHWETTGQNEQGRLNPYTGVRVGETPPPAPTQTAAPDTTPQTQPPTTQAATTQTQPTGAAPSAASVDKDGYYTAPRPTLPQAPTYTPPTLAPAPRYTAPTLSAAPTYTAPEYRETQVAPLDISLGSYQQSPDYQFQLSEGNKNILGTYSQLGALESGAALKALQEFGQNLALGDYNQWRGYTTDQYNTNRNYVANRDDAYNSAAINNAQFGANLANNQWQYGNTFNQNNAQFGANLDNDQWKYQGAYDQSNALAAYNAANNAYQYGTTMQQNMYNSDRDYATNRYDQNTNALLSLAGVGQNATGQYNNALTNSGTAIGNAYFGNAQNQGNAAMASAGQLNNFLSQGVNALAYYYGGQNPTGSYQQAPLKGGSSSQAVNYGYG